MLAAAVAAKRSGGQTHRTGPARLIKCPRRRSDSESRTPLLEERISVREGLREDSVYAIGAM